MKKPTKSEMKPSKVMSGKEEKNGKNGKIEIEISLPMRGMRTAKNKAKKK